MMGNYMVIDNRDNSVWGEGYATQLKAKEAILGYALGTDIDYLQVVNSSWWMGCH